MLLTPLLFALVLTVSACASWRSPPGELEPGIARALPARPHCDEECQKWLDEERERERRREE